MAAKKPSQDFFAAHRKVSARPYSKDVKGVGQSVTSYTDRVKATAKNTSIRANNTSFSPMRERYPTTQLPHTMNPRVENDARPKTSSTINKRLNTASKNASAEWEKRGWNKVKK